MSTRGILYTAAIALAVVVTYDKYGKRGGLMARRPGRGLAFRAATYGISGVIALTVLNVAADRAGGGLSSFRDYLVRRNG
ncbi:MAG: hypothetical protein QM714_12450 [Nocardioides sp.]|uniref:hypothetical protein n=1 Tax=Nocardioides sp. TaxID=35761 RepID=UPI0039E50035